MHWVDWLMRCGRLTGNWNEPTVAAHNAGSPDSCYYGAISLGPPPAVSENKNKALTFHGASL